MILPDSLMDSERRRVP